MQRNKCYRCMKYFQQGQQLPAEDLTYQLKNYSFPIRDNQHKFILLKTIISFLNSRGGTIFIGGDDKTGQVIGITIQRKQQDQYRLFLRELLKSIRPEVDLSQKADVVLEFFPVLKAGTFVGRYIGKITVRQGDTSKLYCLTQRIELLASNNNKKYDQFQIIQSFQRSSMGNVDKILGYRVVEKAAARAANPIPSVNIFHQGCNPQPLSIGSQQSSHSISHQSQTSPKRAPLNLQNPDTNQQQQQNYSIQFFKIKDISTRQKLQKTVEQFLTKLNIKWYIMSYQQQNDTLLIQFVNKKQWNKSLDYIDANLDKINQPLQGCASFMKKQMEDDYAVYQNQRPLDSNCINAEVSQLKQQSSSRKNSFDNELKQSAKKQPKLQVQQSGKSQKKQQQQPQPKLIVKKQSIEQQIQKKQQSNAQKVPKKDSQQYQIKLTSQRKQHKKLYSSNNYISVPSTVNIQQSSVLTITHLNPTRKLQLKQYVQSLSTHKIKVDEYQKTLEFHFESQEDFQDTYDKLSKSKDLTKYGFKGILRFGVNTGQITLDNYDKRKYREFKTYIEKLVGLDIKRCQFTKKGDKYSLLLTLKNTDKAALWLDKLVQDKDIKNFRIPDNQSQKMRIDLVCVKPTKAKK